MFFILLLDDMTWQLLMLRFPATVIAALQIAVLCSLEYPSAEQSLEMDLSHVSSIMSRYLWLKQIV